MDQGKKWGIIGGGFLGMTLAHRLKQNGYDVTLFEAADNFGGLTSAWKIDDVVWDKFYHVILLSDSYTRSILRELDIEKEIEWVETKTGFYTNGKLYSMSNTVEFLKFPPLSLIDKFRLGATIFYTSKIKNWQKLEQKLVGDWLKKLSGKNTFEKMWLPLLRSKLGDAYKRTSAAFIWATIQRMYSARNSGLKKEMFGYVKGGYARILETYVKQLQTEGIRMKPGHMAKAITKAADGKITIAFENGQSEVLDNVIVATPSQFIKYLIPGLPPEEIEKHNKIEYLGVVCASVLMKKAISPYYVTNITDPGKPFTGVIEMTALVDPAHLKNNHLVYLPKYVAPDDPIFNRSDQEIEDEFIGALLGMYPEIKKEDIKYVGIARAKYVFALSTLNYSKNLPDIQTGIDNLYIINTAHITNGTLNVNETVQLAEKAVEQVLNKT